MKKDLKFTMLKKDAKKMKEDKETKESLDLLKKWELIEMVVDMEKTITKYEDKERHNTKQGKADA